MTLLLPEKPDEYFRQEFLLNYWDKTNTKGYDPSDGTMPTGTSLSNVGAKYPSIVVSFSNETSGGQTGYDYLDTADNRPGQTRQGSLVCTIRAEDDPEGPLTGRYEKDGTTAVTAQRIVTLIRQEIERICTENANAENTEFNFVSATPTADVPDDLDQDPAVRIEDTTVLYSWLRD